MEIDRGGVSLIKQMEFQLNLIQGFEDDPNKTLKRSKAIVLLIEVYKDAKKNQVDLDEDLRQQVKSIIKKEGRLATFRVKNEEVRENKDVQTDL